MSHTSYNPNMAVKCFADGVTPSGNLQTIWTIDGFDVLPENSAGKPAMKDSCSFFDVCYLHSPRPYSSALPLTQDSRSVLGLRPHLQCVGPEPNPLSIFAPPILYTYTSQQQVPLSNHCGRRDNISMPLKTLFLGNFAKVRCCMSV